MRHCAIYEVPDTFALPATIPFGQFDGLESCRVVLAPVAAYASNRSVATTKNDESKCLRLETVWKDRSSFADWEVAFQNWLYHETKVSLSQPVEDYPEKQSRSASVAHPWYRDVKNLWLVVANFGTLVAFLQLLQLQLDLVLAPPDVTLLNPNQRLEAFEGELIDLDLTIRNAAPRGSVLVRVNKLELQATDPKLDERNVTFFEPDAPFVIPQLASGNSEELPASWQAAGPGSYRVILALTAKGGLRVSEPRFERRVVDVYRDLRATSPRFRSRQLQGPTVSGMTSIPLSRGERRIRCQLECLSPKAQLKSVTSRFQVAPIVPEDLGDSGSRAVWDTVMIPNRMVVPVNFVLEARRASAQQDAPTLGKSEWNEVLKTVHLYAEEAYEE